jgi:hypothetical protein
MGLVWGRQATEMNIGINLHLDIVESLQASKEVEKKVDVQSGKIEDLVSQVKLRKDIILCLLGKEAHQQNPPGLWYAIDIDVTARTLHSVLNPACKMKMN